MVIMALDHVRDYFPADAFLFPPEDLEATTVPIFLTRWITHYCAPVFVFLAGTSAWIIHQRKSTRELTSFLVKRGIWLIIVEIVIIKVAWTFNPLAPRFGPVISPGGRGGTRGVPTGRTVGGSGGAGRVGARVPRA